MKFRQKPGLLLIIMIVFLGGCTPRDVVPLSQQPSETGTIQNTKQTPLQPSATGTMEITLIPIPIKSTEPTSFVLENIGPFALINKDQIEIQSENGVTLQVLRKFDQPYGSYFPYLSWSPDGTKLAFVELGFFDIKIFDLSSQETKNITSGFDFSARDPSWSPDGKQILFTGTRSDNSQNLSSLFIIANDGTGIKEIYECVSECIRADWSPTSDLIAFEQDGDLFTINLDGSGLTNLTGGNGFNSVPRWSPDGTRIAFIHADEVNTQGFLAIMNSDGSEFTLLTSNDVQIWWYVDWSPLGRYLLVEAQYPGGEPGIYIFDLTSEELKIINQTTNSWPVWYPLHLPVLEATDLIQHQDCSQNELSRISAGDWVQVLGESGEGLKVRANPSFDEIAFSVLRSESIVRAIEGPVCSDNAVFWKVLGYSIPGAYGWIVEGDESTYYVAPVIN